MELRGKRVTVAGMGRSALAAVDLLLREGALPFVTEKADRDEVAAQAAALDAKGVPYEVGGHGDAALAAADLLVLSPGVPLAQPLVVSAREEGIPILGELELAWRYAKAPVLAVTGTNGKTTATELLRAMIAGCGHRVILAGNNDTPFSHAVLGPAPDYYVLEVSSYQLETTIDFRPWIGTVLNLSPDHLGRHQTMDGYAAVKQRLFARQQQGDFAIVNADNAWTAAMAAPAGVPLWKFSLQHEVGPGLWLDGEKVREGQEELAHRSDLALPGRHNLENALAALTMMRAGGFAWERVLEGLREFRGVEHRIEPVACIEGADYYNDSKSTNVDSLRVALESFTRPIVLIAGGQGKEGSDYGTLSALIRARVKTVIALGEEAPRLEAAWSDAAPLRRARTMEDAVEAARAAATAGDVVLLSPGCASFDMYHNFEERGRDFKACVRNLAESVGTLQGNVQ